MSGSCQCAIFHASNWDGRCIKPNQQKFPDFFQPEYVRTQLAYTGVMETAKVRRLGFSMRLPFPEFVARQARVMVIYVPIHRRYYGIVYEYADTVPHTSATCETILDAMGITDYRVRARHKQCTSHRTDWNHQGVPALPARADAAQRSRQARPRVRITAMVCFI